ncbi:unnamed protein product [Musa acuminata subsp. malaccensis]|uniref:(wild Malaysian banana) hypothetical protein n=1 Tax=Musa acuminata subsp. malaccensis TaxID=214687 RepID=A0A804HT70_MUSAM|nr:unnamed protein product [Musa acuminata subsp. malaccensis]
MLAVVVLKALSLFCEAEEKSYLERTGSAGGWDVLFYIFSFLKGISLFTLMILIGTGWSSNPRPRPRRRFSWPSSPSRSSQTWPRSPSTNRATRKPLFLLVDVVCCCTVLFPIFWSIKNLQEAARTAVNRLKLTFFRQYCIVVICYIYITRVVVYALLAITSYRYMWNSVLTGELATLTFYIFIGYEFRPEKYNPYFAINEEEAAAEALKLHTATSNCEKEIEGGFKGVIRKCNLHFDAACKLLGKHPK